MSRFIEVSLFNLDEVEDFVGGDVSIHVQGGLVVATIDGPLRFKVGDTIVQVAEDKFEVGSA